MLSSLLAKLTSDPQRSWLHFKIGLACFVAGAGLIIWGSKGVYWLQIPGLVALITGIVFALIGYVGILVYRLQIAFKRPNGRNGKDK